MTNKAYGKRQKNEFIKRHDITNLLPELDKALQFDIVQLLNRNSSEANRTLRIAALRNEDESLTDLGVSVRAYLLAAIDGIEWKNGRVAIKSKSDITIKNDLAFTVFVADAKAKAEAKAAEAKAKAEAKAAEAKAKAEAKAAEAKAKAAEAKAKAEANKADELAQIEAANADFDAKVAIVQTVAGDKNITIKAFQSALQSVIVGNLKADSLQDLNDTIMLAQLALQAMARQAAAIVMPAADEGRVQELAKNKPTSKEKSAPKKKVG